MPNAYWKGYHIQTLIEKFPEGQIIIRVNNQLAGCALSIVIDYNQFGENHTYREITGNFTFSTHDEEGDMLYGVDVFIKPEFRGLRLGRRLYDYRRLSLRSKSDLCDKITKRRIYQFDRTGHTSKK